MAALLLAPGKRTNSDTIMVQLFFALNLGPPQRMYRFSYFHCYYFWHNVQQVLYPRMLSALSLC